MYIMIDHTIRYIITKYDSLNIDKIEEIKYYADIFAGKLHNGR